MSTVSSISELTSHDQDAGALADLIASDLRHLKSQNHSHVLCNLGGTQDMHMTTSTGGGGGGAKGAARQPSGTLHMILDRRASDMEAVQSEPFGTRG